MHVTMINHTPMPEQTVAMAARTCYSPDDLRDLSDLDPEIVSALLVKVIGMGHLSCLEHAGFTFAVEGISRACSHQLVRHRIASFSQRSQRYVTEAEPSFVVPPSVCEAPTIIRERFVGVMRMLWDEYNGLVQRGIPPEDARFVLPNACETQLVVTMNARELRHFFGLRTCRRAQWEIRDLAVAMLKECRKVAPLLFQGAGPGCLGGACPEGTHSCGCATEVRKELA